MEFQAKHKNWRGAQDWPRSNLVSYPVYKGVSGRVQVLFVNMEHFRSHNLGKRIHAMSFLVCRLAMCRNDDGSLLEHTPHSRRPTRRRDAYPHRCVVVSLPFDTAPKLRIPNDDIDENSQLDCK
jgi:hypothetical protein